MNRSQQVLITAAALFAIVGVAAATPMIDSAVINERVFNDDPDSILTTVNNYPTTVSFLDEQLDGTGFANLHNFRLSENGGISAAVFGNDDPFEFYTDLTITGTTGSEAGINVSPWWSQQVDGRFNVRATDGEVACFGGRLPFYSFTGSQGVTYAAGSTVRLGVIYNPNGLSELSPATIEYVYDDGTMYTSGPLAFDMGNPDEDPPYGLWGMLNDARVGGYAQVFLDAGNPDAWAQAEFGAMSFAVPEPTSLLLLTTVLLLRRR
jgi:hypothetical protein